MLKPQGESAVTPLASPTVRCAIRMENQKYKRQSFIAVADAKIFRLSSLNGKCISSCVSIRTRFGCVFLRHCIVKILANASALAPFLPRIDAKTQHRKFFEPKSRKNRLFFEAEGRRNTFVFQDRQQRKTAILLDLGEFGY